jgi:hypothetical protein
MSRIVDVCLSKEGRMTILTADGSIRAQVQPSGTEHQGMPVHLRPSFEWKELDGPPVKPTRLFGGVQGRLCVLGTDDRLYERKRDPRFQGNLVEPFLWVEVEFPGDNR